MAERKKCGGDEVQSGALSETGGLKQQRCGGEAKGLRLFAPTMRCDCLIAEHERTQPEVQDHWIVCAWICVFVFFFTESRKE